MTSHAELDRLVSELAPIKDEDVRGRADSLQARELFAAIVAAPARPRRLRIALVVASGAAALVAASVGLVLGGSHGTATASAATVLKRASAAARAHALPVAQPGPFVYTKTDSGRARHVRRKRDVVLRAHSVVARVVDRRDTRSHAPGSGQPRFVTDRDRKAWIAAGRPPFTGPAASEPAALPAAEPLDLPTDPDALFRQLQRETLSYGARQDAEMFVLVGDSLRETNASPAQRAALYAVAAHIPGVDLDGRVTDSAGRRGIAVATDDKVNHVRSTLVFDPQTSVLLAEYEDTLAGNSLGYPAATRIESITYLQTAVVDAFGARP